MEVLEWLWHAVPGLKNRWFRQVIIGDAHGNTIKILAHLHKLKIIIPFSAARWYAIKQAYFANNVEGFCLLLDEMTFKGRERHHAALITFVGDTLAERGINDAMTLYLFYALGKHVDFELIFSNHDMDLLLNIDRIKRGQYDTLRRVIKDAAQGRSLNAFIDWHRALPTEKRRDANRWLEYIRTKVVLLSLHGDNKKMTLVSHAPMTIHMIDAIRSTLGPTMSLAAKVDHLNNELATLLVSPESRAAQDLYHACVNAWAQRQCHTRLQPINERHECMAALIWNRHISPATPIHALRDVEKDKRVIHVHGHSDGVPHCPDQKGLNNRNGINAKPIDNALTQEVYTAYYVKRHFCRSSMPLYLVSNMSVARLNECANSEQYLGSHARLIALVKRVVEMTCPDALNALAIRAVYFDADVLNALARRSAEITCPRALNALAKRAEDVDIDALNILVKYAAKVVCSIGFNALAKRTDELEIAALNILATRSETVTCASTLNAFAQRAESLSIDALNVLTKYAVKVVGVIGLNALARRAEALEVGVLNRLATHSAKITCAHALNALARRAEALEVGVLNRLATRSAKMTCAHALNALAKRAESLEARGLHALVKRATALTCLQAKYTLDKSNAIMMLTHQIHVRGADLAEVKRDNPVSQHIRAAVLALQAHAGCVTRDDWQKIRGNDPLSRRKRERLLSLDHIPGDWRQVEVDKARDARETHQIIRDATSIDDVMNTRAIILADQYQYLRAFTGYSGCYIVNNQGKRENSSRTAANIERHMALKIVTLAKEHQRHVLKEEAGFRFIKNFRKRSVFNVCQKHPRSYAFLLDPKRAPRHLKHMLIPFEQ